jgi:hypothetical protein
MRSAKPGNSIFLFLLCLLPLALWGQGEAVNARLSGTVSDPENAVVAGAAVTLSNMPVGFVRQATTSAGGQFVFTMIPPGAYELKVEKPGFRTYLQSPIVLAVGQASDLSLRLELGRMEQVVEVRADAPMLNTANANVESEVSAKQVAELPLGLRNVFNLVLLSSSVNNSIEYQGLT